MYIYSGPGITDILAMPLIKKGEIVVHILTYRYYMYLVPTSSSVASEFVPLSQGGSGMHYVESLVDSFRYTNVKLTVNLWYAHVSRVPRKNYYARAYESHACVVGVVI